MDWKKIEGKNIQRVEQVKDRVTIYLEEGESLSFRADSRSILPAFMMLTFKNKRGQTEDHEEI